MAKPIGTYIHATATVDPAARIGDGCFVGPYCYVGPRVTMGDNNRLEAYVSVGTPGEHRDHMRLTPGPVEIGSGNIFREFVTVNGGTSSVTRVEDGCTLLRGSHVGHDALIRQGANLSCNVVIGGHAIVGQGANLGIGAAIHQNRAVGAFAMVGMNGAVTRHLPPFIISFGVPSRPQRLNRVGLSRAGVSNEDLLLFEQYFQHLEQSGGLSAVPHAFNAYLERFQADCRAFDAPLRAAS